MTEKWFDLFLEKNNMMANAIKNAERFTSHLTL